MASIVGCIVGEEWTTPVLVHLCVTSDGGLLGMQKGHIGFNDFIGSAEDLRRNWDNLLNAAGLNDDQRKTAELLYRNALSQHATTG
jgi:hypothetical protein